jgi:DNA-binding response OmpR family regulator
MNQNILIIEDDRRIAEWVKIYFERAGFLTEVATDGKKGLNRARILNPDLIVLDVMLPNIKGFDVCQILRMESDVPIIILTAKGSQTDRLHGLEYGADDYIVKPFDPEELVARAKAVLRRYQGRVQTILRCGALILDERIHQVHWEDQLVEMSRAQFAVLAVLMRHPNQVLSRSQLINLAYSNNFTGTERAIDTHVRRLRKKIHSDDFQPIQTVYGAGYKFVCED